MKFLALLLTCFAVSAQPLKTVTVPGVLKFASSAVTDLTVPPTNTFVLQSAHMPLNGVATPGNTFFDTDSNQYYMPYLDNGGTYVIRMARATNGDPGNPLSWNTYGAQGIVTNASANGSPHMLKNTNGYYYVYWGMDDGNIYVASNNVITNLFANTNSTTLLAGQVGAAHIVYTHTGTGFQSSRALECRVWFGTNGGPGMAGLWNMLFMAATNSVQEQVFYATSSVPDGTFTLVTASPVIPWGGAGSDDAWTDADPWQPVRWHGTDYIGYSFNKQNGDPWGTKLAYTTLWDGTVFSKYGIIMNTNLADGSHLRGSPVIFNGYYVLPHAADTFYGMVAMAPAFMFGPSNTVPASLSTPWDNSTFLTCQTWSNCFSLLQVGTSPGVYSAAFSNLTDVATWAPTNLHQFYVSNTTVGNTYYYQLSLTNTAYSQMYTQVTGSFVQQSHTILSPTNSIGGIGSTITATYWWEIYPTNQSIGSTYTTNSSRATIPNLTSYGSAFDLTNGTSATTPFGVGSVGGKVYGVGFDGNRLIDNDNVTAPATTTIYAVAVFTNFTTPNFPWDSKNSSHRHAGEDVDNTRFNVFDGAGVQIMNSVYQHPIVMKLVFNDGGNDYAITNGVKALNASGNGNDEIGFRLGMHNAGIDGAKFLFLSWHEYTNQLFGTYAAGMFGDTVSSNEYYLGTNMVQKFLTFP